MFEEDQQQENQLTFNDYLRIIYRGKLIILVTFFVIMTATVIYTFTAAPSYESRTTLLIESTGAMERSIFDVSYFGNQTTLLANQMEILKSRSLGERVIKRLDLSEVRDSLTIFRPLDDGSVRSLRSMVGWLQENLEVNEIKNTDIIELKFQAGTPFESAFITNVISEEFQLFNSEANRVEISDLRVFLEKQLDKKGQELQLAEENLREFQERENVADLSDETAQLVNRLAEAEAMQEQAQVELDSYQERKQSLMKQIQERKISLAKDLSEISTPYLTSLQNTLAEAVAERTKFLIAVQSSIANPNKLSYESQLAAYDEKIDALRQKLEEESGKINVSSMVRDPFALSQDLVSNLLETETHLKSLTAKIAALKEIVTDYENKLRNLPEKTLQLARLERRRKVLEEIFVMMTSKLEETKIQEAGQSKNVSIIDEAIEPVAPVSPNKKMNFALGALIGLGLGIGLTFLKEYFDNSIKSIDEVEKYGFNLLGTIPTIERDRLERKLESKWESLEFDEGRKIESRLITHLDPKSPISEAYRTLRTNIQFSKVENSLKTILVTSSGPKEGKSTTVANLAITFAQMGSRVLLVDTDLRRPVIHSIFGLEKDIGVTNYMMGASPYEQIFKKTFLENLKVVTSGILPPNPSELLGSQKMEQLIEKFKKDFEIILFDSPPVIAVTDAAILSTKLDATFVVISAGHTNRDAVRRAKSLLDNVNARLIGALLNNVNVQSNYGSTYYYYYYHYYYGNEGKAGRKKRRREKNKRAY